MAEKTVVQWHNSYSIGIRLIDEQHRELINLTNKLYANCMSSQGRVKSSFLKIIRETVDYAGYHFGTEEKIMERIDYPDYAFHKREHTDFVKEVYTKVEDFKGGRIMAPLYLVYFLRDWVLQHIAIRDKKLGQHILAMKRNVELQGRTDKVKTDMVADLA